MAMAIVATVSAYPKTAMVTPNTSADDEGARKWRFLCASPKSDRRIIKRNGDKKRRREQSDTEESTSDEESEGSLTDSTRRIGDEQLKDSLVKQVLKRARKVAKRLKTHVVSAYTNERNPFGDTNLSETFVWRKKIERDLTNGFDPRELSLKAQKNRLKDRLDEIEKVKKRREERAIKEAHLEEEMAMLARDRARAEFQRRDKKEEEFHFEQSKLRSEMSLHKECAESKEPDEAPCSALSSWQDEYRPGKPKYFISMRTGYEWNKYNQTHFDHDNPPPKFVQGYKFKVLYPDLVDPTSVPTYVIETDGSNEGTCLLRFHAGPPYEDIKFKIVNKEWETSPKKGYKCTFEGSILRVYFDFLRCKYRR